MKIAHHSPEVQSYFTALLERLGEVNDLRSAADLLGWDQTTYMPPGGAAARARQLATLQRFAHEKFIAPAIGHLLGKLEKVVEELPPDDDAAALIRVTRRDYERLQRIPSAFTAQITTHIADSYEAWAQARPANDFARLAPYLEKTLALSHAFADFFPGYHHVADPLINLSDYGMTVATVQPLLRELRTHLQPIVKAISAQPAIDDRCLTQAFPEKAQWDFGVQIIQQFGYDFQRGRQDNHDRQAGQALRG